MSGGVMEKIKRAMPLILSGIMVITVFMIQFIVVSFRAGFLWRDFLSQLAVNLFLLVGTATIWMNAGTDRAKTEEPSAYSDNCAAYSGKVAAVSGNGQLRALRDFCRIKTEEMRTDKIRRMLNSVGLDMSDYTDRRCADKAELKGDGYTRRQIRMLRRLRDGRVRVRPVQVMEIMADSKGKAGYETAYNEDADKAVRLVLRVIKSVVMATVLALLAFDLSSNIRDLTVWALFFFKLLTILYTAFSAEREGYLQIAQTRNRVILQRIEFLNEFEEWVKVPRLNPAKTE